MKQSLADRSVRKRKFGNERENWMRALRIVAVLLIGAILEGELQQGFWAIVHALRFVIGHDFGERLPLDWFLTVIPVIAGQFWRSRSFGNGSGMATWQRLR